MSRENKKVRDIFSIGFFNLWVYLYIACAIKISTLQFINILIAISVVTIYTVVVINKYRKNDK